MVIKTIKSLIKENQLDVQDQLLLLLDKLFVRQFHLKSFATRQVQQQLLQIYHNWMGPYNG